MEQIGTGANRKAALDRLLRSESPTTALSSRRHSLAAELVEVHELGYQMVANYSGQALVDGQAELWMKQWSAIALRHGVAVLRDALWQHMERSQFLPTMADVNDAVATVLEKRRSARDEDDAQRHLSDLRRWRAQWEADRKLLESEAAMHVDGGV